MRITITDDKGCLLQEWHVFTELDIPTIEEIAEVWYESDQGKFDIERIKNS